MVPAGNNIVVKPMFGNVSAFVNGNMFFGLYGNDLLLRLPEEDIQRLVKEEGAAMFEPMKGRKMRGYVLAPKSWVSDPKTLQQWIARSLKLASALPPKSRRK
jgi:TfoX/Sxy family transcriptional regulator of competence genes